MSEIKPAASVVLGELKVLASAGDAFVAGGPVRDWLLGRGCQDIDMVFEKEAVKKASVFAGRTKGHFVPLDLDEGVARVILPGIVFDFSQFRQGAVSIYEDLRQRDFTFNALAIPLESSFPILQAVVEGNEVDVRGRIEGERGPFLIIDPTGGMLDLQSGVIRAISLKNLDDDPLRLLRAYRFRAQLGFDIEEETAKWIEAVSGRLPDVSPERVSHELGLIMDTGHAARVFSEMLDAGLLFEFFPELYEMRGVEQPGFHHLDVLGHSLEALRAVEDLIKDPCLKFLLCGPLAGWIAANPVKVPHLKWAALFHDTGKPSCKGERGRRATFYHHDEKGAGLASGIGNRLRWSRRAVEFTSGLIGLHMRPFHLLTDLRRGGPSLRAMRRLVMEINADYPALFLLSMADSMAGCGPLKPPELDLEIARLWEKVHRFYVDTLTPTRQRRRLLTGHDIIAGLGLSPGPIIGKALDLIEEAQLEGLVRSREEAVSFLSEWLKTGASDVSEP